MRAAGVMAVMIAGYSLAMWGYTLVRGYDVALPQLINPLKRWGTSPGAGDYTWPPGMINDPTVLLPTGASLNSKGEKSVKPRVNTGGGAVIR